MKKTYLIKLTHLLLAGTLTASASSLTFAQIKVCDTCSAGFLAQINDNITAIKNAIVSSTSSASQNYGDFIAAYNATETFSEARDTLSSQEARKIGKAFRGVKDADDNADNAYKMSTKIYGDYSSLSADSLFGPNTESTQTPFGITQSIMAYGPNQQKAAENYMSFLAGNAIRPVVPADDTTTSDKNAYNNYRTNLAVQSIGAYNLSKIYANHYPIQTPSSLKSLFKNTSSVSLSALLNYIQETKVSNADWLQSIATDSPVDLSRKTVYMLVGIFSTLRRMEENQEQMLATQTGTNTLLIAAAQQTANATNQAQAATSTGDDGDISQYIDNSDNDTTDTGTQ